MPSREAGTGSGRIPTPLTLLPAGNWPDQKPSHVNSIVNCGVSRQLSELLTVGDRPP
jgi:hypothetical protein